MRLNIFPFSNICYPIVFPSILLVTKPDRLHPWPLPLVHSFHECLFRPVPYDSLIQQNVLRDFQFQLWWVRTWKSSLPSSEQKKLTELKTSAFLILYSSEIKVTGHIYTPWSGDRQIQGLLICTEGTRAMCWQGHWDGTSDKLLEAKCGLAWAWESPGVCASGGLSTCFVCRNFTRFSWRRAKNDSLLALVEEGNVYYSEIRLECSHNKGLLSEEKDCSSGSSLSSIPVSPEGEKKKS